VLIGLSSSGVHSNGYSLVRRIVEKSGVTLDAKAPFDSKQTLGEALLTPTRIYVKSVLAALHATSGIKALAHITGGGFVDNIPRVLPENTAAKVDLSKIPVLPVFKWLAAEGGVAELEMLRTFNCGIGLIIAADAAKAGDVENALRVAGEKPIRIGEIVAHKGEPVTLFDGKLALA